QNAIIKGIVLDTITKAPVEFANVVLFTVDDSVFVKGELTDSTGRFELKTIRTGTYFIKISSLSYKPITSAAFVLTDQQVIKDMGELSISKDATQLEEVAIIAEKPPFERQFDKTILNVSSSNVYKTAATA